MEELVVKLKQEIVALLNLENVNPADIQTDAPLFNEGLGLDSIDALELIVLLQKNYGVKLKNAEEGKQVFASVRTIAEYIQTNQK
jgi:acyl carrier protein